MDSLVLYVMLAAFGVAVVIFVTVLVALRADHARAIRGPMETLEALDARIATKRDTLTDLEEDLAKRREALANIAEIQTEVDELARRRDELVNEHAQLGERREEVAAMRREAEAAHVEFQERRRELDEAEQGLDKIKEEAEHARTLAADLERLTDQKKQLDQEIEQRREQIVEIDGLVRRERELRERSSELERDIARLEGETDARQARLEEAAAAARAAETALAERRDARDAAMAEVLAAQGKAERLEGEVATAEEKVRRLGAEAAALEARIAEARKSAPTGAGGGDQAADPLEELRGLPPVLTLLRSRETRAQERESEALHRVATHLEALGLSYPRRVLHAFHTAMKVNDTTQMAVLAGISGTGKSQLPRRYAEGMGIGFLQVSVQPRWDSPQDLMGFYNYIEGRFRPTDMARALFHLDAWNGPEESRELQDRMLLILLDEMNLARVEYYFSDFLSRLESRPPRSQASDAAARKDAELELDMPVAPGETAKRIFPGYNVLFAGTMNEDESTQSLSDKVVDRANVIRFAAPKTIAASEPQGIPTPAEAISRKYWEGWLRQPSMLGGAEQEVQNCLEGLVERMHSLGRPIGHRLGRAITAYVANYPQAEDRTQAKPALADQVEMRLLPKLRGVEVEFAEAEFDSLRAFVERDLDDPTLAQAIADSVDASRSTGQFAWRGVTR